jgi:RNA polymerase sigma-70 factor (ECF subfamily)
VTDEDLMAAVREGDLANLGPLFERHHASLFEFLSRVTGDRLGAEDLVQDVFVRILKYRATYRNGACFETWMFRIARNARADYYRSRPRLEPLAEEAFNRPEPAGGPGSQLEASRDRARLRRALLALPEDKRELIVLARYHHMKHERIAELLGIDAGAVKVRLHRALRELREAFQQIPDRNESWDVKKHGHTLQTI